MSPIEGAAGYCTNYQTLLAGAYPPLLPSSDPLANSDPAIECALRCLADYPGTTNFYLAVSYAGFTANGCACASDNCAAVTAHASFKPYAIVPCPEPPSAPALQLPSPPSPPPSPSPPPLPPLPLAPPPLPPWQPGGECVPMQDSAYDWNGLTNPGCAAAATLIDMYALGLGNTFTACEEHVRANFPNSHYIVHNGGYYCYVYPPNCPNGYQYGLRSAPEASGWTSCVLGGGLACGNDPECCGGATGTGADSLLVCLKSVSICSMHAGCCANYTHNSPEHHECVVDFLERNSDPAICGTHSFYGGGFYESYNANYDWFQCHGFLDIMGNPGTLYAAGLTGGLNSSLIQSASFGILPAVASNIAAAKQLPPYNATEASASWARLVNSLETPEHPEHHGGHRRLQQAQTNVEATIYLTTRQNAVDVASLLQNTPPSVMQGAWFSGSMAVAGTPTTTTSQEMVAAPSPPVSYTHLTLPTTPYV